MLDSTRLPTSFNWPSFLHNQNDICSTFAKIYRHRKELATDLFPWPDMYVFPSCTTILAQLNSNDAKVYIICVRIWCNKTLCINHGYEPLVPFLKCTIAPSYFSKCLQYSSIGCRMKFFGVSFLVGSKTCYSHHYNFCYFLNVWSIIKIDIVGRRQLSLSIFNNTLQFPPRFSEKFSVLLHCCVPWISRAITRPPSWDSGSLCMS